MVSPIASPSHITALIYMLLILTPMVIALGQVLFKMVSQKLVTTQAPFYTLLFDPLFIAAICIYGGATVLWTYVLKTVPLGKAYSFMALTFVLVPLLAVFWLGETVTVRYVLGAILIILGLIISQS